MPTKRKRSPVRQQYLKEKDAARGFGPAGQHISRSELVATTQQAQQQAKAQQQAATALRASWMREADEHDRTKQVSVAQRTDTPSTF
jgi:hypothetical protein